MRFVVIGGHAINSLGLSRQTGDLDLLVPLGSKAKWQELMSKLRYTERQSDNNFSQFAPSEIAAWPIDLMYTDDSTFEKVFSGAVLRDLGLATVPVAAPRHMVLLKLHAMKQVQEHRFAKDYGDVLFLLRHPECGITRDELRGFCQKYAAEGLFDRLNADLNGAK